MHEAASQNHQPNVFSTPSMQREGVDIQFSETGIETSERWRMDGWLLQYFWLPAGANLELDPTLGRLFIKVITGRLASPDRGPFAAARSVRSTRVIADAVQAGPMDTLIAVFVETSSTSSNVTEMKQLAIEGPNAGAFAWRSFDDRFGEYVEAFKGVDAYMSGGFHLLNRNGTEISYVNLWTAGKGVNLTTHNHAGAPQPLVPAFAEVHWVFNNGTGSGGMYSTETADGPKIKQYPMQRGDEHGPFFNIDAASGRPLLRGNGSVDYPWHGWESGTDKQQGQAYDVVAAFETNPQYVET